MIRKIGIIVQGPNDRGFLMGLQDRLGCHAELVPSRIRGRNKISIQRDARENWKYFQRQSVDLVVRLTDSDADRWQDVRREEVDSFPEEMRALLVCGVVQGAIELWLSQDRSYLQEQLGISASHKIPPPDLIARIKSAIARNRSGLPYDRFVRNLVRHASSEVFKNWLKQASLRAFYKDCRDAALREKDCRPLNDELRR